MKRLETPIPFLEQVLWTLLFVGMLMLLMPKAHGAPGDVKTNSVTLTWDLGDPTERITHHKVYFRTNFPPGMPMTNAPIGEAMQWIPPDDQSGWELYLTITNLASDGTLLNVTNHTADLIPGAMFFVITANNERGESPFSNVAWLSAIPNHRKGLRIEKVE